METLKQEAINVIAGLPDDADMEELMYASMCWRISGAVRKTRRKARPCL